jgi:hypothetical protein
MKLVLRLRPSATVERFHELERQLKQDFADTIEEMHLEGKETDPT